MNNSARTVPHTQAFAPQECLGLINACISRMFVQVFALQECLDLINISQRHVIITESYSRITRLVCMLLRNRASGKLQINFR